MVEMKVKYSKNVWICEDGEKQFRISYDPFSKEFYFLIQDIWGAFISFSLKKTQIRSLIRFLEKWGAK